MAQYDLKPIVLGEDLQGTYDLLRNYFVRGNNTFNVVSDYIGEDSFTMDIVRSYSFIASDHRASIHLAGTPTEDGGTKIALHVKSVEDPDKAEKEIRDRIENALGHILEEKQGTPVVDTNVADSKKEKRDFIIGVAVLAVIAIGAGITGIVSQYSSFWAI